MKTLNLEDLARKDSNENTEEFKSLIPKPTVRKNESKTSSANSADSSSPKTSNSGNLKVMDTKIIELVVNSEEPTFSTELKSLFEERFSVKTEKELISLTKLLHRKAQLTSLLSYWLMGKSIKTFYKTKYGEGTLKKLADKSGISEDTIRKACRFADRYDSTQLLELLGGNFTLSWYRLSQNLSVEPQKLIEAYKSSMDLAEFNMSIIKLKNPDEKRGRKQSVTPDDKKPEKESSQAKDSSKSQGEQVSDPSKHKSQKLSKNQKEEKTTTEAQSSGCDSQKLDENVDDVAELREKLLAREERIKELELELDKLKKEIKDKDATIDRLKKRIAQLQDQLLAKTDKAPRTSSGEDNFTGLSFF